MLTLFRIGLFGTAYGWEVKGLLPKTCHTYGGENWHSYTLSKDDPKNI